MFESRVVINYGKGVMILQKIPHASRVILLGASNLSLELSSAVRLIGGALPGPIDYHIADGFGRSYGKFSSVLSRVLPGITQCDLWSEVGALCENDSLPLYALLTDFGNDIAYGVEPMEIAEWVETCLRRLEQWGVRIVMTALPRESLLRLSPSHLDIVRGILFPSCRLSPEDIIHRVCDLDEKIISLADKHGVAPVPVDLSWYGLDPIHIRRKYWSVYWERIISNWMDAGNDNDESSSESAECLRADPLLWCYLWTRWAKERRVLGVVHRRLQPSGLLRDGSSISVY